MKRLLLAAAFLISRQALASLADGSCQAGQTIEVATQHETSIGGKPIGYTATAGFIEVTAADKSSKACVFYTSYVVNSPEPRAPRPLLFAFNGGPGSASLWLHLGLLAPKRVDLGPDGLTADGSASAAAVANPNSPLDLTDIVVIDAVATGFSHTEGGASNDPFTGVFNDYTAFEMFIQNYLNLKNRWTSPKYILGESYGGIRGSLLAHHLQSDLGIAIQGLILISPALSGTTLEFGDDNMVPYWTNFPNYATSAWYHKKIAARYLQADVETVYKEAKKFAWEQLRTALESGSELAPQTRINVAQGIADFTGLSLSSVLKLDLRVGPLDIFLGLLENEGMAIGRYDARFAVPTVPGEYGQGGYLIDPSSAFPEQAYTVAINQYLRVDLGFNLPSPYVLSADIKNWPDIPGHEGVTQDLSFAMVTNPGLRLMVASGYFDLACPMATVDYELSVMPKSTLLAPRIRHTKYFGGHMMYINPPALELLKNDLRDFITGTTALDVVNQQRSLNLYRQSL